MDSVIYSAIFLAVVVAGPAAFKLSMLGVAKLAGFLSRRLQRSRKKRMLTDKKFQKQQLKSKGLEDNLGKKVGIRFFNQKTNTSQKMNVVMDKGCNIDDDVILKGMLTVRRPDNTYIKETIYLFQPELFNGNGQKLGPVRNKDGTLSDNDPYFAKTPNGEVVRGYALKREVTSGMTFDFVKGSAHSQIPGLEKYISIDIPRDEKGNYIPMDVNDPKELKAFKEYIENRQKIQSIPNYLHFLIDTAQEAKEANKGVVYAEAREVIDLDAEREAREEAARDAKDKPFDANAHLKVYEDVYGKRAQMMREEAIEQGAIMLQPQNLHGHRVMGARPHHHHHHGPHR